MRNAPFLIGLIVAFNAAACGGRVDGPAPVSGTGGAGASTGGNTMNAGGQHASGGQTGAGGDFGTGGDLTGSCNPAFCSSPIPNAVGCCVGPNGPCGVNTGAGCIHTCDVDADCPPPPMICPICPDGRCGPMSEHCQSGICLTQTDPCPPSTCVLDACPEGPAGAPRCCLTPDGPCGVDYGNGCVDPSRR